MAKRSEVLFMWALEAETTAKCLMEAGDVDAAARLLVYNDKPQRWWQRWRSLLPA